MPQRSIMHFCSPGYLFNAPGEENNSDNLSVLCQWWSFNPAYVFQMLQQYNKITNGDSSLALE